MGDRDDRQVGGESGGGGGESGTKASMVTVWAFSFEFCESAAGGTYVATDMTTEANQIRRESHVKRE